MRIFLDCTNTVRTGTHTGIQRVVRNIAAHAPRQTAAPDVQCVPVLFHHGGFHRAKVTFHRGWKHRYRDLLRTALAWVRSRTRPLHGAPGFKPVGRVAVRVARWLLLRPLDWLEVSHGRRGVIAPGGVLVLLDASWSAPQGWSQAVARVKHGGTLVVAVVYDLIPVTHGRLMPWWVVGQFKAWLQQNI